VPGGDGDRGCAAQPRRRWDRGMAAEKLRAFEAAAGSQRQRAASAGVPRSTAVHWRRREAGGMDASSTAAFLASPEGIVWMTRVATAAMLVILLMTGGGLRTVQVFLRLSGLSEHVASSFGSLQQRAVRMYRMMVGFERQERARLGQKMVAKMMSLALDETFFPETCLVAMDPASGFILVEKFVEQRDTPHWRHAVKRGLRGLPVNVVQSPSDEGQAIVKLVREDFEAEHTADLFHVQHAVTVVTARPLAQAVHHAQQDEAKAVQHVQDCERRRDEAAQPPRSPGRPLDHGRRVNDARDELAQATARTRDAVDRQERLRVAVRGLSQQAHPYDIATGALRTAKEAEQGLHAHLDAAQAVVAEAGLPERTSAAIRSAGATLASLVDTIAFFHRIVAEELSALSMSGDVRDLLLTLLVPAHYLQRVARQTKPAAARHDVEAVARRLLDALHASPAWQALDAATAAVLDERALSLSALFQRSSSCVEGRNGRLSFFHHGVHTLRPVMLRCLTIVHNYVIRRDDGTTAAQRFFGHPPRELFPWLLERLGSVPRPARARAHQPQPTT